ncbi:MAG: hypothetical protein AMXMBFR84_50620 [Candidatus Hydrogenedentota bacterium]
MAMKKSTKWALEGAVFVALGATAAFLPWPSQQADANRQADLMSAALDAVEAAPSPASSPLQFAQAEDSKEVRGAPLDAPVKGEPIDAPPAGVAAPDDGSGLISPEAFNQGNALLEKIEGESTGDAFDFKKTKDGKFTKVTFNALGSFEYVLPNRDELLAAPDPVKALKDQIPEPIKKLQKSDVVLVGFMVPIDIDREGNIKSFALTQNQMFCCFGVPPAMNEWVMVNMAEGKHTDYIADLPVAVYGSFAVGEELEDGFVMSVYRMAASEVVDVHELIKRAEKG